MTEPIEVIVQGPDEGEGERLLALLQQGPVPSSDGQDTGATPDEDNEVTVVDPTYWASQPRMVMEVLARTSRLPPQERDEEYWNAVGKKSRQERLTLTVEEAAEALGISRAFAYESVRRGDIPHIKIGRRILIPKAKLEELLHPPRSDGRKPQEE